MGRITQAELVTNTQMNTILGNTFTSRQCFHAATGVEFWLTMAGPRGDHFDVSPTTEADAKILENLIKRVDLNRWTAEGIIVIVGNRAIAAGLSLFMHGSRMGRANPGAKYPSLSNTRPAAGWGRGGHMCLYVSNSTGGAGDNNNPLVSAASNNAAGTARGRQARAACFEANLLARSHPIVLERINSVLFPTSAAQPATPSTPVTPPTSQQSSIAPNGTVKYTVQQSDQTWSHIAKRYGLTSAQLQTLNPTHTNINVIIPGKTILNVPAGPGSTAQTPPTPAPAPAPAAPTFNEYNVRVQLTNVASSLNIRSVPDSSGGAKTVVGSLRHGDVRTVVAESAGPGASQGWVRVRHGNTILGWISRNFTVRV